MADSFEDFLGTSLAPSDRAPDRLFVARVQTAMAVERRLKEERREVIAALVEQLVALLAVAAAVAVLGRAAPVAEFFAAAPALGLGSLLAGFALVIALVSYRAPVSGGVASGP